MKANRTGQMLLILTALFLSEVAVAGQECVKPTTWLPERAECHPLMMERECANFKASLTTLPQGPTRTGYLNDMLALMLDRELACGGGTMLPEVILAPKFGPQATTVTGEILNLSTYGCACMASEPDRSGLENSRTA